jgi:hypothetical protein
MRNAIGRRVRLRFGELLADSHPQFLPLPLHSKGGFGANDSEVPAGCRLFEWAFKDDLRFYIVLLIAPDKMNDSFTIECAWTTKGHFPASADLWMDAVRCAGVPPVITHSGDFCCRLGNLFAPYGDYWWWVAPQPPFVEVFAEAARTGMPPNESLLQWMSVTEATTNIDPRVREAVEYVGRYAVPYFQRVIEENAE